LRDEYRVTLFKKELRKIIRAPWARFYYSKGGCHICIDAVSFGRENLATVPQELTRAGIEFVIDRDPFGFYRDKPELERPIWSVNIPIDQAALPERLRPPRNMIRPTEKGNTMPRLTPKQLVKIRNAFLKEWAKREGLTKQVKIEQIRELWGQLTDIAKERKHPVRLLLKLDGDRRAAIKKAKR
jgi:hypothetical protein